MVRIWSNIATRHSRRLVRGVRHALADYPGELRVSITPAASATHVEIVVREDDSWRGACMVAVDASSRELILRVRQAVRSVS